MEGYSDKKNIFFTTHKERMADVVEAMNTIVCTMNDEEPYYDHWIWIVPDGATREDFEDIAENEELLDDTITAFKYIVKHYFKEVKEEDCFG